MCDDLTIQQDEEFFRSRGEMSRRGFAVASLATLAACATSPADARAVTESQVTIATPDGACDAHFVHPVRGAHPGVLVWPDALGLRPAFEAMGKRLAQSGYAVLTVNPYYRLARAPVAPPGASFSDPETRAKLGGLRQSFTPETQAADATAFVDWLDAQRVVDRGRKIGTTGYCMGGVFVLRTAAAKADRIAAAATFHAGNLVTQTPQSPHLLIPQTRAGFLIAIAQNDDQSSPTTKDTLRAAFADAQRPAEIEVYPAQHGWCAIDSQVYDQAQADRAWARLLALFQTALV